VDDGRSKFNSKESERSNLRIEGGVKLGNRN
jgi:hypothetical protein